MRNYILIFFTCLFLIVVVPYANAAEIKWYNLDEAKKIAETENKKVFINFHADWCKYCHLMKKNTFSDASVISYLNKYFVSVRVDTMKEKKLAAEFRVRSLPANWFLSEKGEAVDYSPGYFAPHEFMKKLEYIRNERYKK